MIIFNNKKDVWDSILSECEFDYGFCILYFFNHLGKIKNKKEIDDDMTWFISSSQEKGAKRARSSHFPWLQQYHSLSP